MPEMTCRKRMTPVTLSSKVAPPRFCSILGADSERACNMPARFDTSEDNSRSDPCQPTLPQKLKRFDERKVTAQGVGLWPFSNVRRLDTRRERLVSLSYLN